MIDAVVPGSEALPFAIQLKALLDQEAKYQPKLCGLRLIESANDSGLRMTARLRDFEIKDLLSLTRFFGFSAETFSLAVNLLDRFLAQMKVQPKHLSCVGLCCFYLAVKSVEEERNVPLASDLIRISQRRFTVSDMMRMEKIIIEKLYWKIKSTTALQLLRLYHSHITEQSVSESKKLLNVERLEAQLKACHCCFAFSKAKISCRELFYWRELVAKCLAEYSSPKCAKPSNQKLRWIVSGRTARQLKHSYYRIAHLPTIPETA
ncbi:cyclin-G1-like isoform X2 [Polyodon spathula]|uniref:cyclin-G1-like isoform X2 n=1 Tax=Polyodon spathula TaxID=7913 RepID=UPI001B7E54F7|nr:cyclin-G1-like isoform X2 [Polyodon spathula]